MPRRAKLEKQQVTVVVNNRPVSVILHPPTGVRSSWYAYWNGLVSSRSTGKADLQEAIRVVEGMLRNDGRRATLDDSALTDEAFEALQVAHYARKTDPAAKARAEKTLAECLDAIAAFKAITGLERIAAATPDDCARFQTEALTKPRNWRTLPQAGKAPHPSGQKKRRPSKTQKRRTQAGRTEPTEGCISPNTVLKWSRMLQAAFDRANRNAGKKCVRGKVPVEKLLSANPWTQFTWVEGTERPIRQFDSQELLGFLTYLEEGWPEVPVAALATKVFLWSCCRKQEVASLTWDALRLVDNEVHFEVVGKWGVERWFRLPEGLYRDMEACRTESPFVFAAYTEQIRKVHGDNPGCLKKICQEFDPRNFGRWIYERVKDWAASQPKGNAYVHVFRKTGLQLAHDGEEEEASQKVAADAGVSESVLLGHYVKPKLWRKSNRTYRRLLASLPPEVARRYGYVEDERTRLERQLEAARDAGNWTLVGELAARLGQMDAEDRPQAG